MALNNTPTFKPSKAVVYVAGISLATFLFIFTRAKAATGRNL